MNGRCSLGAFDWRQKGDERLVEHILASMLMLPAPVDDLRWTNIDVFYTALTGADGIM